MNDSQHLTIQLSPKERYTLLAQAQRRNMTPDILALELIKDGIAQMHSKERHEALNALEGLDELVSRLPQVDIVELVRIGREELEQRGNTSK